MKLNQNFFLVVMAIIAGVCAYMADGISMTSREVLANKLIAGTLTLIVPSAFIYYLRGTKYDVYEEIFDHKNIAAAILIGLAWVSLALSFTIVS